MSFNRRSFIRYASLASAGHFAGLRPFGALNSLASSSSSGYKALVCIFLYGGNDSNNTIVPFDTKGYGNYEKLRGPLALNRNELLQLSRTPDFALHPALGGIRSLYDSGTAAIVANVGTLLQPLTRTKYLEKQSQIPTNLFSHPDQQLEWQNAAASETNTTGWAGRIADNLTKVYNVSAQIPMVTSVDGDSLFCNGSAHSPVSVTPGHVGAGQCSEGSRCAGRLSTAQQLIKFSNGLSLVQADNQITGNAYKYMGIIADAVQSVSPLKTTFPANNGLAAQLQQIAQIIQVRQALGVNRQIFFAGIGNFDTHSGQLPLQNTLLSQISPAMASFYQATEELGIAGDVTSFTMSDFSRALQPNTNDGSDHAWGGHHIVMGGAVQGGKMYGTFPTLALGGPDDSDSNGRWVPSTASVQYASTLASWFGVSNSDLSDVFPTIGNFSEKNLGFLG